MFSAKAFLQMSTISFMQEHHIGRSERCEEYRFVVVKK